RSAEAHGNRTRRAPASARPHRFVKLAEPRRSYARWCFGRCLWPRDLVGGPREKCLIRSVDAECLRRRAERHRAVGARAALEDAVAAEDGHQLRAAADE